MPITGITSSAGGITRLGSFESIASAGPQVSCATTFSNIPQTYTHLQLRVMIHDSGATSPASIGGRFNNDSATNYMYHRLYGNGVGVYSENDGTARNFMSWSFCPGTGIASNIMGVGVIDILDYTNTNKFKTVRGFGGYDSNVSSTTNGFIKYGGSVWLNTAAITSITVFGGSGGNSANNTFALYGIKA